MPVGAENTYRVHVTFTTSSRMSPETVRMLVEMHMREFTVLAAGPYHVEVVDIHAPYEGRDE